MIYSYSYIRISNSKRLLNSAVKEIYIYVKSFLNITYDSALQKAFDSFDTDGKGYITPETIGVILRMMGVKISEKNLQEVISETDEDGGFWTRSEIPFYLLYNVDNISLFGTVIIIHKSTERN